MPFSSTSFITTNLSRRTPILNLPLYAFVALCLAVSVALFLLLLALLLALRRRRVISLPSPPSSSSRKPLRLFLRDPTPAVSTEVGAAGAKSGDESLRVVGDEELAARPEAAHLGWGCWYTLREMEAATGGFAEGSVIGEGGYGVVYRGVMGDGTIIAIKNLLNNRFWLFVMKILIECFLCCY